MAASSLFTSGRFAIDPELRGAEFERITQNLDVHFWKAFWNITEMEVLSSLANMASATVRVSRLLSLPPEAFEMPLTADPTLTVTISPPLAHTGPGPVLVRLISYDLREGQVGFQPQPGTGTQPRSMGSPRLGIPRLGIPMEGCSPGQLSPTSHTASLLTPRTVRSSAAW